MRLTSEDNNFGRYNWLKMTRYFTIGLCCLNISIRLESEPRSGAHLRQITHRPTTLSK